VRFRTPISICNKVECTCTYCVRTGDPNAGVSQHSKMDELRSYSWDELDSFHVGTMFNYYYDKREISKKEQIPHSSSCETMYKTGESPRLFGSDDGRVPLYTTKVCPFFAANAISSSPIGMTIVPG